MKIKIEIKHWITGAVLFEYESENNTIKDTLVKAVARGADLRDANLRGADLWGANLRDANLRDASLRDAKNLNSDYTDFWWHIHHEQLYEYLTEPIRARINYIKENKPKDEIELRLKLLKPVLGKIPTTEAGWKKLHKIECPKCPWDYKKKTIFPKK